MPAYEYKCDKCGAAFEVRRNIDDAEGKAQCPVCGESDTHRIYSWFARGCGGEKGSCAPAPRFFGG